jgi:hypothetical protein
LITNSKFGRLLDRQIGWFGTAQDLDDLPGRHGRSTIAVPSKVTGVAASEATLPECSVTGKKPKTKNMNVVDDATYKTAAEAENEMKIIKSYIGK